MYHSSYTKIIATLGPASSSKEVITSLFNEGADVFRLNFSHGTHDAHQKNYDIIRELEKEKNCPICVLADLQGPKLRVGCFEKDEVLLENGQEFRLDLSDKIGNKKRVSLLHPEIFAVLKKGAFILVDDGRIRLKVIECSKKHAVTEVIVGGVISNHKGVNVPNISLPISALTDKDKEDLKAALDMGADWVALSFVQRPEDVIELRELVDDRALIMAKLEKPSAIDHLDEIIEIVDGVMVARGDLGVELSPEMVPIMQKKIIKACRFKGVPVVVATQMLETMITSPTPTRAEASDVATAVYEGADAVMLSAETAAGEYPTESVKIMDSIINHVEEDDQYAKIMDASRKAHEHTSADAITAAARQVVRTIDAALIITYTLSGSTTLRAARERPCRNILCLTPNISVARRLQIVWGVRCILSYEIKSFADIETQAIKGALSHGMAKKGESMVITAGVPFGQAGTTNILRIVTI